MGSASGLPPDRAAEASSLAQGGGKSGGQEGEGIHACQVSIEDHGRSGWQPHRQDSPLCENLEMRLLWRCKAD